MTVRETQKIFTLIWVGSQGLLLVITWLKVGVEILGEGDGLPSARPLIPDSPLDIATT